MHVECLFDAACSAITLPESSYPLWDSLPEETIEKGKLSQLQLEGVLYACTKHQQFLPNGQRKNVRQTPCCFPCIWLNIHGLNVDKMGLCRDILQ